MANRVNIGAARIPDVAKLPVVALPTVGLRGVAGGGSGGYWPAGTPEAIRQSCMLWYDVARQGCTNEAMAADPVLRDLSGNGHDATCYNFAWSGMSGVGGYEYNLITPPQVKGLVYEYIDNNTIHITYTGNNSNGRFNSGSLLQFASAFAVTINSVKFLISGLPNNWKLNFNVIGGSVENIEGIGNGEITIPAIINGYNPQFRWGEGVTENTECDIYIKRLPLYPNALVSDGVDDYCLVGELPLLTKENGYTVIAKRKYLTDIRQSCLASKRNSGLPNGAFVFELYITNWRSDSFGHANSIPLEESDISYQITTSYNKRHIDSGEELDNNVLNLFNLTGNYLANVALYSFILFNRDLTEEEIEWVKTNMMQQ